MALADEVALLDDMTRELQALYTEGSRLFALVDARHQVGASMAMEALARARDSIKAARENRGDTATASFDLARARTGVARLRAGGAP